jgi:ferredoxin--NADP+ reductase
MLADLPACEADGDRDQALVDRLLRERGVDVVTYDDWLILDRHEVAAGRDQDRPRVKVTTVPEMLAVIRAGR